MSKILKIVTLTVTVIFSANFLAFAETSSSLQDKINENQNQIYDLENEKDKINEEINNQNNELNQILNQINEKSSELEAAREEVRSYQVKIDDVQAEIDNINNQIYEAEVEIESREKIIEEKEAIEEEKKINIVNSGIYIIPNKLIKKYHHFIKPSVVTNEYYLTDLINYMIGKEKVMVKVCHNSINLEGVNDIKSLERLKKQHQNY